MSEPLRVREVPEIPDDESCCDSITRAHRHGMEVGWYSAAALEDAVTAYNATLSEGEKPYDPDSTLNIPRQDQETG